MNPFTKQLGDRIAKRRRELGMSQADLASLMRCDQGYISRYESGQVDPLASTVRQLALVLRCQPDDLIG